MPLYRRDGSCFGTLCALDPEPSDLSAEAFETFQLLANLIAFELEAEEAQEARETALQLAHQQAQARQELMAILGHDLVTPLTAIRLGSGAISMSTQAGEHDRKIAERITGVAGRMGRMISDLLDFTRARLDGGIPLTLQTVDAALVSTAVVQEMLLARPGQKVSLVPSQNNIVVADPDRMAQVVTNLLNNALRHSDGRKVTLRITRDQHHLMIEVTNHGQPIPAEVLPRLFEPFRRDRSPAKPEDASAGLGLGLHIVQEIMNAHGGRVEVNSSRTKGTRVRTFWPIGLTPSADP